jgi:hypothetical protein
VDGSDADFTLSLKTEVFAAGGIRTCNVMSSSHPSPLGEKTERQRQGALLVGEGGVEKVELG